VMPDRTQCTETVRHGPDKGQRRCAHWCYDGSGLCTQHRYQRVLDEADALKAYERRCADRWARIDAWVARVR
jgi:hypothetical protein